MDKCLLLLSRGADLMAVDNDGPHRVGRPLDIQSPDTSKISLSKSKRPVATCFAPPLRRGLTSLKSVAELGNAERTP
jgi:hypothetical protein